MKFRKFQRILIIFLIAIGFFYGGYYFGKRGFVFEVRKNPPEIEISNKFPPDGKLDFSLFRSEEHTSELQSLREI
jgi:hypothetical protein